MSILMNPPKVVNFSLDDSGSVLVGYAAPVSRGLPCVVKLLSDGEAILYARASRYSTTAADAGIRLGWCGFELAGVSKAFAVGDRVEIACAGSGEILHRLALSDASFYQERQRQISAEDVIRAGSRGEVCEDPEQLVPFMIWHRQRHGLQSLIDASFQTLLGRLPEGAATESWLKKISDEDGCSDLIHALMKSDEFLRRPVQELPGPFHQAFRFDRGLIG